MAEIADWDQAMLERNEDRAENVHVELTPAECDLVDCPYHPKEPIRG